MLSLDQQEHWRCSSCARLNSHPPESYAGVAEAGCEEEGEAVDEDEEEEEEMTSVQPHWP